jgi:hypothetical protein
MKIYMLPEYTTKPSNNNPTVFWPEEEEEKEEQKRIDFCYENWNQKLVERAVTF